MKLYFSDFYRRLGNFDNFLYQTEGEADPITVSCRKTLFQVDRHWRFQVRGQEMMDLFDEAWDLYKHACFKYPKFAQVGTMQEELYEKYQRYLREMQLFHREKFKQAALQSAKLFWPMPSCLEALSRVVMVTQFETDDQNLIHIMPIKKCYGPLDLIHYYDGPQAKEMKTALAAASQFGLAPGLGLASAPQVALDAFSARLLPEHEYYYLTKTTKVIEANVGPDWRPLIADETRRIVAIRLKLDR
jgi:hypothetical protein